MFPPNLIQDLMVNPHRGGCQGTSVGDKDLYTRNSVPIVVGNANFQQID
jgi:hypothetical protein